MSDYSTLFSRNLGLVTPPEQERLRGSRVAVAGLGGVGGIHLATLARMGIGRFTLADLDTFSDVNMNRQYGASAGTIGRPKVQVMAEIVRSINPDAELRLYENGVQPDNVEEFLHDADAVVDSIDFSSFARAACCTRPRAGSARRCSSRRPSATPARCTCSRLTACRSRTTTTSATA